MSELMNVPEALRELIEDVLAAGWDAFDRSEECLSATKCPEMPGWLQVDDVDGIHFQMVCLAVFRRFGAGKAWRGKRGEYLQKLSVLLFMAARGDLSRGSGLTALDPSDVVTEINGWVERRLNPSKERLVLLDRSQGQFTNGKPVERMHIVGHPGPYEPALTLQALIQQLKLGRRERHLLQMKSGMAMNSQGTLTPKEQSAVAPHDMMSFFDFVSGKGPIVRIESDGSFSLSAYDIKGAMDRVVRADPRPMVKEKSLKFREGKNLPILEILENEEVLCNLSAILDRRRVEARSGSAKFHVLEHFEALQSGRMTYRELKRRSGKSSSALQEAMSCEMDCIKHELRVK